MGVLAEVYGRYKFRKLSMDKNLRGGMVGLKWPRKNLLRLCTAPKLFQETFQEKKLLGNMKMLKEH